MLPLLSIHVLQHLFLPHEMNDLSPLQQSSLSSFVEQLELLTKYNDHTPHKSSGNILAPWSIFSLLWTYASSHTHAHNCFTVFWILSVMTRVSRYQKKHSLTHTYRDHQSSLICFLHLLRSMASSLFNLHACQFFPQSLSKFSLVYLLAWHLPLHTPYISSPNRCLLGFDNRIDYQPHWLILHMANQCTEYKSLV